MTGVDNDPPLRLQILAGKIKPFFEFRRKASLDLYRPRLFAWRSQLNHPCIYGVLFRNCKEKFYLCKEPRCPTATPCRIIVVTRCLLNRPML